MAKKKETAVAVEEVSPDILKGAVPANVSAVLGSSEMDELRSKLSEAQKTPKYCGEGWEEYVMSQFKPNELQDGRPKLNGLIRVCRLLLGPVIEMNNTVLQCPTYGEHSKFLVSGAAVVQSRMTILFQEGEFEGENHAVAKRTFTGLADVWSGNCEDTFARFAVPTAETRAIARCYRQALALSRAVSDELTDVPVPVIDTSGEINDQQIKLLDNAFRSCDINAVAFIKSSKSGPHNRLSDVKYETAAKMLNWLTTLKNDKTKIPEDLKGYQANWRENF